MTTNNLYLCVHGHFYQPPRENPWTGEIDWQEGAKPFHDWNEKIHQECYEPNSLARVLDANGRILDIVNNYEDISFNFGPTLLSWLEVKHPDAYRRILKADEESQGQHHGHGNAIAQVYNHMILPLANHRDKETQIKWGLQDFRQRFGRESEALWLPETACNEETLEALVGEGIKFIILAPHQAEAVRPLGTTVASSEAGKGWQEVASGQIDPKHPYRCFLKKDPKKYIDIFFYDGPISKDIGFGHLLFHAGNLMGRIEGAVVAAPTDQLIHVATDGETYGHHKVFGDRVLAYALKVEAKKRGFRIVNYGEYLASHLPQFEVCLKEGKNGEGTSWSCPHGVERWKDHCGCQGDGAGEWTQHWRKPVRDALDWLRDELAKVYENSANRYLREVWNVRNDYIAVVLNPSQKNIHAFMSRHSRYELSGDEIIICLKLLEMQRNAMLMYTSCGWFFTEISGIETLQILAYASRAIQLAQETAQVSLEEGFLERLKLAKSNVKELGDGKTVYQRLVKTKVVIWEDVVNYHAIMSMLDDPVAENEIQNLWSYRTQVLYQRKESYGTLNLNFGRIRLALQTTTEEKEFLFIAVQLGAYDFRCSVKPLDYLTNPVVIEKELFEQLHSIHIVEIMRRIDEIFGKKYYALKDLPIEHRMKIITFLTRGMLEKINSVQETLYEENRRMNEIYRSIHLSIPEEIREAVAYTLERKLKKIVYELEAKAFDLKNLAPIDRILEEAKSFDVNLKKSEIVLFLSTELAGRSKLLAEKARPELIRECLNLLKLAKRLHISLDLRNSQDCLFFRLREWRENPQTMPEAIRHHTDLFSQLLEEVWINPEIFLKVPQVG